MYTVCPSCTRQFQIFAEHLSAAAGQVRCGFCHEQFNAMERLYDEPLSNDKILRQQLEPQSEKEEPQFEIPETITSELVLPEEEEITATNIESEKIQGLQTAINEIGIRPAAEDIREKVQQDGIDKSHLDASEDVTLRREIGEQNVVKNEGSFQEAKAEEKALPEEQFNFPELEENFLLDASSREKNRWSWLLPFFWTTATMIALIAIIAQLAWFNRDRVLLEYPELLPYAKQVCEKFDCQLIREKDVSKIKLINRDVRLHPTYQDTLLVNAAMKNELSIRQPYPKVQLTLFDTVGSLLGYRVFAPEDYLDNSIQIDKGMPVDSPVYFVLEVSGPAAGAVSFEFRFL